MPSQKVVKFLNEDGSYKKNISVNVYYDAAHTDLAGAMTSSSDGIEYYFEVSQNRKHYIVADGVFYERDWKDDGLVTNESLFDLENKINELEIDTIESSNKLDLLEDNLNQIEQDLLAEVQTLNQSIDNSNEFNTLHLWENILNLDSNPFLEFNNIGWANTINHRIESVKDYGLNIEQLKGHYFEVMSTENGVVADHFPAVEINVDSPFMVTIVYFLKHKAYSPNTDNVVRKFNRINEAVEVFTDPIDLDGRDVGSDWKLYTWHIPVDHNTLKLEYGYSLFDDSNYDPAIDWGLGAGKRGYLMRSSGLVFIGQLELEDWQVSEIFHFIRLRESCALLKERILSIQETISQIQLAQESGMIGFETKAIMDSSLNYTAGTLALVTNDPTAANNAVYRKIGNLNEGSWIKSDKKNQTFPNVWTIGLGQDFNDLQEANDSPLVNNNDKLYFAENLDGNYNLNKRLYLYGLNRRNLTAITGSIDSTQAINLINMKVEFGSLNSTSIINAYDSKLDIEANALVALRLYLHNSELSKEPDGSDLTFNYAFDILNIKEIRLYQGSSISLNVSSYFFGSSDPATIRTAAGKLRIVDGEIDRYENLLGVFHNNLTDSNLPNAELDYSNVRFESSNALSISEINNGIKVPSGITENLNCIIIGNRAVYKVVNNKSRTIDSSDRSDSIFIELPKAKIYKWEFHDSIKITEIKASTRTGSCDLLISIDGVNVTPTATTLNSTNQTLNINNANTNGVKGQFLEISFSSITNAEDVTITIFKERTFL